ncbi:hypothetical protein ACWDTI_23895 [Gordonia sp. NPDC003424]
MPVVEAAAPLDVGSYVRFRGDVLQIEGYEPTRVTARDMGRQVGRTISMATFFAEAQPCTRAGETLAIEQDLQWDLTSDADKRQASVETRELLWVIFGAELDDVSDYEQAVPLKGKTRRVKELAARRQVSERTIWRQLDELQAAGGPTGVTRPKATRRRRSAIDPRWEDKFGEVISRYTEDATWDVAPVLEDVEDELVEEFGEGVVRVPGKSTAYAYVKENFSHLNSFKGSAKGRRSIAQRPEISLRQLKPTHAGEYVIMDTQVLDVFAMEPATRRWVQCQLTIAMDLYTRAVVGLSVTPVSTKAVDVATVLFETCHPRPIRGPINPRTTWNYHGVPENIVFTERSHHWGMPLVAAENLIVDNGRAFISTHVMEVCHRKGINLWPAQPYKPTDKPTVERFFGTLRRRLIMRLPGYKGPDVYSRGLDAEDDAFFFVDEIENIIRHWVTRHHHKRRHAGLVDPRFPHEKQSPNRMYEVSVEVHGLPRMASDPYAFVEFLPTAWRKLHHYGFEVGKKRRYRGDILNTFDGRVSPYSGHHAGQWPIRYNPDDITLVYVQDPRTHRWHELEWEHAHKFTGPMSEDTYAVLRKWALRRGESPERTKDILVDCISSIDMSRHDRNALIRSVHMSDKRTHGTADTILGPALDPDLAAPESPPKPDELEEISTWDLSDIDDVVGECMRAAGVAGEQAEQLRSTDPVEDTDNETAADDEEEPADGLGAFTARTPDGLDDDDDGDGGEDDDYVPKAPEIR